MHDSSQTADIKRPFARATPLDAQVTAYSIVIPAYNEADNIEPLYAEIIAAMQEVEGTFELVFVDDAAGITPVRF